MTARARLLGLVMVTALGLAACSKARDCADQAGDAAVVDPALLAFLSRAKSAHHRADLYEGQQNPALAVGALEELVKGPVPGPQGVAPEAREVLADSHARLADLKSQLGQFDAAAREVELGLERVTEPSYFRGHLFEMRGLVEERRARDLKQRGQTEQASAAEQRALQAYEESMRIQSEAIRRALPSQK